MNWFWMACGLLAAIVVWDIDSLFWLRLGSCLLCIDVSVEAGRAALANHFRRDGRT